MLVHSCLTGQGYLRRRGNLRWLLVWRRCSRSPTS
jgi:hypothetical protein